MRYLKNWNNFGEILEAFKSEYLSSYFASLREVPKGASPETIRANKELKKLNSEKFIRQLEKIGDELDFPISEIPDEFLFYLPYKEAWALNYNKGDSVCKANSESLFGESGVAGEICNAGKIKKKSGKKSIREVTCTSCGGSGIAAKVNNKVKWIKFWFDTSGNFIKSTAVDGVLREISRPNEGTYFSNFAKTRHFKKGEPIDSLRKLNHGDVVIAKFASGDKLCKVWYDEKADTYNFIQDSISRSTQNNFINLRGNLKKDYYTREEYKKFNKDFEEFTKEYGHNFYQAYTWNEYNIHEAIEINENENENLSWNSDVRIWSHEIELKSNWDLKDILKSANYAIVLDYLGLSESGFKKRKTIIRERDIDKEGLIRPEDYEDIRSKNLEKRISKLSDKYIVGENLENLKVAYGAILNGKYMFIQNLLHVEKNSWGLSLSTPGQIFYERLSTYTRAKSAGKNIESSLDDLNTWIKYKYSSQAESYNLAIIINDLKNDWKNYEYIVGAIEKLEEMSKWTWNKFSTIKIEDKNDVLDFNDKMDAIYKSMKKKGTVLTPRDVDYEIQLLMSAILAYVNKWSMPQGFESLNQEDLLAKMDKFIEKAKEILS